MREKDYLFEIAKLALQYCLNGDGLNFTKLDSYIANEIPEELWQKIYNSIYEEGTYEN